MGTDANTVGSKLVKLRKIYSLNQSELAEILGVSISTVSRIEKGQIKKLSISSIQRVISRFNLSPSFFYDENDEDSLMDSFHSTIVSNYDKADEKTKKAINILLEIEN